MRLMTPADIRLYRSLEPIMIGNHSIMLAVNSDHRA